MMKTKSSNHNFYWLLCLFASFAYDIPLFDISNFEKLNPRLFEIVSIYGALFVLPKLKKQKLNSSYTIWKYIVLWSTFCGIVWFLIITNLSISLFILFYVYKYIQGLIIIYIALLIPINQERKITIIKTIIFSGVFVSLYAIPEYIIGNNYRTIAGDKILYTKEGTLLSCLGTTYHHLSFFSNLCFSIALSYAASIKRNQNLFLFFAYFISWTSIYAGSRIGLFSFFIISFYFLIKHKTIRRKIILSTFMILMLSIISGKFNIPEIVTSSTSFERFENMNTINSSNSISSRIDLNNYNLSLYEWQGVKMLIIGGGFYVVPHLIDGNLNYRIGYGIHNSYLFALEQGGIVLFILFLSFLIHIYRRQKFIFKYGNIVDRVFVEGALVFFVIQIFSGIVGGNSIFMSVGMESLSTYILLIYFISIKQTSEI